MTVTLLPGTSVASAIELLTHHLNRLSGARSGDKYDVFTNYLRWATQASTELHAVLPADEVEYLVLTQRHWTLCGIDPASNEALVTLVQAEIAERDAVFRDSIDELRAVEARWQSFPGDMLVPDTNVLIHHTKPLDQVEWRRMISGSYVRLVIPILVVDELDRRKRDRGETRTRARQTLRTLKQSFENPAWAARLSEKPTDVESMHLWLDPQRHRRLPDSDLELIDRSVALQVEANRAVTLVTFDTGMALRALAAGLSVHHLEPGDDRSQV